MNGPHQDFDISDGEEPSRSSAGSSVPLCVHLLHHGHDISCSQTQLSWTFCGNTRTAHCSTTGKVPKLFAGLAGNFVFARRGRPSLTAAATTEPFVSCFRSYDVLANSECKACLVLSVVLSFILWRWRHSEFLLFFSKIWVNSAALKHVFLNMGWTL